MKKLCFLILSLLLISGILSGCGDDGKTTTSQKVTAESTPAGADTTVSITTPTTQPSVITTTKTPETEALDPVKLATKAAAEGIVLLKNEDKTLPFTKDQTVAMFGKGQVDLIKGGTGSGDVYVEHIVGILEGMDQKVEDGKVKLYETVASKYRKNSSYMPNESVMRNAAQSTDAAVYVITRNSGEGGDRSATAGDYYLSDMEIKQLELLIKAGYKDIVVILNVGGMIDTTKLLSYPEIKSILLVWQPGQYGGNAIADVLVGDVTPSGKLSDTFAKNYNDYITSAGFHESADYVKYTEDVYVGYRYFETFDPNYQKVNFEFGFGLSYTDFSISDVQSALDGNNVKVTAKVTNTGEYSGKEVVQVYFSAPQGKLGKPAKELAGFAKTNTLAPGKSETVTIAFPLSDMASYDDTGLVKKSSYVLEAGDYRIYVGNSIKNAGENGVRYTHTQSKTQVTEQLTEQVAAKLLEKRLKADGSYENIFRDDNVGISLGSQPLKVEAEDFYRKHEHAHVKFNSDATKSGLKILTSDAGNRYVIFAFDVKTAGNYAITLGIGNSGAALENAVLFYVNDVLQAGSTLPLPRTGGDYTIQEVGSATVRLTEGVNLVKILFNTGDSFLGFLDYIRIEAGEGSNNGTLDSSKAIAVKKDGITKIEGELYATAHNDVGTEPISAGDDLGGTTVKNLHTKDYYVSYLLSAEKAGSYRIVMRVANGLGDAANPCTASVNNVKQDSFGYTIPYTGVDGNQWFVFRTVDAGIITLKEGENTLTFTVIERMGNLDWFTLEPISESTTLAASQRIELLAAQNKIDFTDLCEDPALMDSFLDQLTVEQLVYLLHGHGENLPNGTGTIGGIPEYGIPSAETADGPAGLRLSEDKHTTAWPIQTMLACTWNRDLLYNIGKAIAAEATKHNVDIWLAPGVNIHRNPLCGRNFEYYSEDPLLSGEMASAIIMGLQDNGIGVALKHFVGNEKETNRGHTDSRIPERALREIYLKPFEIAVKKAQPWLIMTSYNKVNGVETAENPELLTNIVRGEWGFTGAFTTDWWNDSIQYKEVLAGNDLKMKSGDEEGLLGAYKSGILTRDDLEACVARILTLIMKSKAKDRISETSALLIPADTSVVIHSIDSTWKSDAVGMESCQDIGGGYNTTNTYEGQWVTYTVNVEKTGRYTFTFRVASENGTGGIRLSLDGKTVGNFANTLKTGGWQVWGESPHKVTVTLSEGVHQLRFDFTQGGFNYNTFTITPVK
ncbi:MAG: glycoside hydrolase family 3 C-terminal domain-containing protein [Clostridia bacterium]|nr:glycoside hydrolase family 3 C-terminal domain-containing protein [Clostridia bacterium]